MDRGSSAEPLSWLLAPAAIILVASALTLPLQPYTGVALRGSVVMAVDRASPGALAGLAAGDRLEGSSPGLDALRGPLAGAQPGVALELTRERAGTRDEVRIVPSALPTGERRMMAALLAVASGFLLLGGWVWSERRDRLTRPFQLLCLAFATLLAPFPRLPWAAATAAHEILYTGATLVLPAACVHFFALFPEPRAPARTLGAGVRTAYGIALGMFLAFIGAEAMGLLGLDLPAPAFSMLESLAAVWFAAGLLAALVLFVRSYARAASVDARRRIRVTLIGSVLGLAPLATLTVVRNLAPGFAFPGERIAVTLTLLVPLSFAWAIAIHRIFDFRVALRGALVVSALALAGAALIVGADLFTFAHPGGPDYGALALAAVALGAAVTGPARPTLGAVATALLPLHEEPPLFEAVVADMAGRSLSRAELLRRVCVLVEGTLKLERCEAADFRADALGGNGAARDHRYDLAEALLGQAEPAALDDLPLAPHDRERLEARGVAWVLPIGDPPAAALLLGPRLAGAWLDRREIRSLVGCSQQLALMLENLALKHDARSRVTLDRELQEAGALQAHLLPRRAPLYATLDCAAASWSSEAVGGDYYDFVERPTRAFTLVVADAAGHGVPAALLLAGVQARFRSEAVRDLEPGILLHSLNAELARHDQPGKFVGVLCARVEVARGRIQVANAGLVPPLVRRRDGEWEELTTGGLLLGVRADSSYPGVEVDLGAGDVALICTDGLTEARRGDSMFGTERIRDVVDRNAHRRASDILDALIAAVREFAQGPMDDLTLVVLKQLADPARPLARRPLEGALKGLEPAADTIR